MVLRWRGGLERIEGFCLLADCCQIEWSEEIGLERAGLNGENSNLSLDQRWIWCKKQTKGLVKCSFVACWFIDESEVSLVFTMFSIDEIRKNRRNI